MSTVNPYRPPEPDATFPAERETATETTIFRRAKTRVLIWMLASGAVLGLIEGFVNMPDSFETVLLFGVFNAIVFGILLLRWCDYDRAEYQMPRWRFFAFYVIVFPSPLVIMPIYLLASRGARGFWAIVKAAGFLLVWILVALSMEFLGIWLST